MELLIKIIVLYLIVKIWVFAKKGVRIFHVGLIVLKKFVQTALNTHNVFKKVIVV